MRKIVNLHASLRRNRWMICSRLSLVPLMRFSAEESVLLISIP
jgi:hypothetical protein